MPIARQIRITTIMRTISTQIAHICIGVSGRLLRVAAWLLLRLWLVVACVAMIATMAVLIGAAVAPSGPTPATEYVISVGRVEYRADNVAYQGDRLVLEDYWERRGGRWRRTMDVLVISGDYTVRQYRVWTQ